MTRLDGVYLESKPRRVRWLRLPAIIEIALDPPITGITTRVIWDDVLLLKRELRRLDHVA